MLNLPVILEDLLDVIHQYEARNDTEALAVLLPMAEAVDAVGKVFRARRSASIQEAVQRHPVPA